MDCSTFQGHVLWENDFNTEIKKPEQSIKRWICWQCDNLAYVCKGVLDSIQHIDHMDAGESHYSQVFYTFSKCKPGSCVCVLAIC
jgi:hypothetical protein